MFNAEVYTVSIPSSDVALEDEYMAQEVNSLPAILDVRDLSPAISEMDENRSH